MRAPAARLLPLLALLPCFVGTRTSQPPPIVAGTELFRAGDGGCAAFRVPALVATGGSTLLAFAECRKWTCDDYGRHDLVMRRSTDGGRTFLGLRTLLEPNRHWPDCNQTELPGVPNDSEGGACFGGCAVWDPTAVADNRTGAVWVFFGRSTSSCPMSRLGGRRVDLWALKSTDAGVSFSPPQNLTAACSTPYGGGVTGSGGHGVQLRGSGELMVPLYGCGSDGGQGLCVSDDSGATWRAAAGTTPPVTGANNRTSTPAEGEVVELFGRTATGGRRLLYDTRPVGGARCTTNKSDYDVNHQCRLTFTSENLGESWSNGTYHPELPDPSCKGGIVRWDRHSSGDSGGGALFAVGAASSTAAGGVRTNATLSWSTDDGVSFPGRLQLDPSGGYATVQVTGDGMVAALFEAPVLGEYSCWAPCGKAGNATNNGTNCCTMAHYYQPPGCPLGPDGRTTLPNCTWLLDCNCNPVGCGIKLALVDPLRLLPSTAAALRWEEVGGQQQRSDQPRSDQQVGGRRNPTPVTVDWSLTLVTRTAAPSVLVAADPEWTPEGKLSAVAIDGVRKLAAAGADNIRLLNFNIFPEMSVAQLEENVWNFTRMDQVVLPFLDACGNASVMVDIESSPAWMWEAPSGPCPQRLAPCGTDTCADAENTDLSPSSGGGYGNRLRCPHWGDTDVPRDKTWKELATYFSRVSDWYTKGGFTLPDGTRHESGHRYKLAIWEIWNEVNLGREHGMTKEGYIEYYDAQVAAMQSSAGGAVSKVGGPSLAGLNLQKVDEWMPYLLDAANHKPNTTPFDALTFHQYCMCENRTGAGMEVAFEGVEQHLSALQRVQHWRDTLRPEATLHLTESGLICNAPKGCGGNNYSCYYSEFDDLYWLASGSQWLYQYLRSAEAADLATIAQSQILGYPHKYDGLSGEWPCGSMVDWTKTTPAGGFPVSKQHEGALNAKYWVELLLLQHVSRPFSFHPTTNISTWPSPPIYVQGISSSKGKVIVVVNTKSTQQEVTLAGGAGKKAYTICMEYQGPAGEHTLAASTVALPPFATMFVVWEAP